MQMLGLSWAPGWDCQSLRAAQPGRQCLVEPCVSAVVLGNLGCMPGYLSLVEPSLVENSYTGA